MRLPVPGHEYDDQQRRAGVARYLRQVQPAAAVALAALSLAWLWQTADVDSVWPLLERAHLSAIALAVALLGASLTVKALRWRVLLPGSERLTRVEAYRIFHISLLLNNLLPFRVGDGARILSPSVRRTVTAQQAVLVLATERVLDAVALLLVAVVVLPAFLHRTGTDLLMGDFAPPGPTPALVALAAVAIAAAFTARVLRSPRGRITRFVAARWRTVRRDLAVTLRQPRMTLLSVGLWTALAWVGTFLLHYAILEALRPPQVAVAPLTLAIVVTLTTNASMLAPTTPGGIGIVHAAAAAPLLAAGFASDVAVAYAVLVHAVNTVPPIVVGAACLGAPAVIRRRGPGIAGGG